MLVKKAEVHMRTGYCAAEQSKATWRLGYNPELVVLLLPFWGGDSCSALQIALLGFHCLLLLSHSIKASGDLKGLPKERLDHSCYQLRGAKAGTKCDSQPGPVGINPLEHRNAEEVFKGSQLKSGFCNHYRH